MALIFPDKLITIFDLEFTDVALAEACRSTPEVIEIGAVRVTSDLQVEDRFSQLVRPAFMDRVTEFTTSLTGITQDMLETAPSFREVWKEWCEFTLFNKSRLCSWGCPQDVKVLDFAYRSIGLGWPHMPLVLDAASIVYSQAAVWGFKCRNWSLASACKRFDVEQKSRHRALPDAEAILAIFERLSELE